MLKKPWYPLPTPGVKRIVFTQAVLAEANSMEKPGVIFTTENVVPGNARDGSYEDSELPPLLQELRVKPSVMPNEARRRRTIFFIRDR